MPRRRTSRVYVRNRGGVPRYYGDFRDLGGGQEALKAPGDRGATSDPDVAQELATRRVKELRQRRTRRVIDGVEGPAYLSNYAAHHLVEKARSGRVTEGHLAITEHYFSRAIEFFGPGKELITIDVKEVQGWIAHLQQLPNGRGGTLAGGSVRKHLNALGNLFRRAQSEGLAPPGHNPVAALLERPVAGQLVDTAPRPINAHRERYSPSWLHSF